MNIIDAEPILGGERLTFYYLSEDRIDFRDLVRALATEFRARIELRQVGARDEARLTADYERCGQYCCCKNFLKVLKPISMKSAKMQKATLDPLKISGRCGRLMCCLRYEDQSYEELSKRLPRKKSRVGTPEGDGTVIDGQILTQLVLVRLDEGNPDGSFKDVAVPVEELTEPKSASAPPPRAAPEPRGFDARRGGPPQDRGQRPPRDGRPRDDRPREGGPREGGPREAGPREGGPREGREGRPQEPRTEGQHGQGNPGTPGPQGSPGPGGPRNDRRARPDRPDNQPRDRQGPRQDGPRPSREGRRDDRRNDPRRPQDPGRPPQAGTGGPGERSNRPPQPRPDEGQGRPPQDRPRDDPRPDGPEAPPGTPPSP